MLWDSRSNGRRASGFGFGLGGLLLALTGIALWQFRRDEPLPERETVAARAMAPLSRPAAVSHEYIGSNACRECHSDIWKRYQSHPMAQSMSRVHDAIPLEESEIRTEFSRGRRDYRVERNGARVFHHERQV